MSVTIQDKTIISLLLVAQVFMIIYLIISSSMFSDPKNDSNKSTIIKILKTVTFWKLVLLIFTFILTILIQTGLIDYTDPQNIMRFEGISICLAFMFWIFIFFFNRSMNVSKLTKRRLTEGIIGFSTLVGSTFLMHRGFGVSGDKMITNIFYIFCVLFILYSLLMYIATHSKELKPDGKKQWLKVNSLNALCVFILTIFFTIFTNRMSSDGRTTNNSNVFASSSPSSNAPSSSNTNASKNNI